MDISGQYINLGESFGGNLVLLLIAIGLTSFAIPLVFKLIDEHRQQVQQLAEAETAKQNTIISAQIDLLDRLTEELWKYQHLAAMVLYSRQRRTGRDDLYHEAASAYDRQSGEVLATLRGEISGLMRLAPRAQYERFLSLLQDELLPYDHCLLELMRIHEMNLDRVPSDDQARCSQRSGKFAKASWPEVERYLADELGRMTDDAIASLADELQLSVSSLRSGSKH